jgi:hypothetical protein
MPSGAVILDVRRALRTKIVIGAADGLLVCPDALIGWQSEAPFVGAAVDAWPRAS